MIYYIIPNILLSNSENDIDESNEMKLTQKVMKNRKKLLIMIIIYLLWIN